MTGGLTATTRRRSDRQPEMVLIKTIPIWTRTLAAIFVALLLVPAFPVRAGAHTQLTGSSPADGSVLTATPQAVQLVFTDSLVPQFSTVTLSVNDEPPQSLHSDTNASTLTINTANRSGGRWKLSYRVTAQDGHPLFGAVTMTIDPDNPVAQTPPTAVPADPSTTPGGTESSEQSSPPAPRTTVLKILVGAGLLSLILVPVIRRYRTANRHARKTSRESNHENSSEVDTEVGSTLDGEHGEA